MSTLRLLRKQAGLTQAALALWLDCSQQRISALEHGAPVSAEERVRLAEVLQAPLEPPLRDLPRAAENSWFSERLGLYTPPTRKTGSERLRTAVLRFGAFVSTMWAALSPSQRHFLELVSSDSVDEWMLYLHRSATGMQPTCVSPQKVGVRHLPVVDPESGEAVGHRAFPALIGEVAGVKQLILPQVCLQTRPARYTLDFALVTLTGRRRLVVDGEVDGTGHRSEYDRARAQALRLPELRFGPGETLREDFNEIYDGRLAVLLRRG